MSKTAKIIIIAAAALLLVGAVVASVLLAPTVTMKMNAKKYDFEALDLSERGDRIYFLNTRGADALLIESDGKYALIDAAEDSDNPRGFEGLELTGYEEYVVSCVKKIAGDENGKVTLDFVLGTHAHSDHIGGFDTLILDEDITVKKAFLREYDESIINEYEKAEWDNREVYEQMMNACKERNVPVIHDLPKESFTLGSFTITLFNTEAVNAPELIGENEESIGVLVEKDGVRAFLAGDINNIIGTEDILAPKIGEVDLLKVGHHGYAQSTTDNFVKTLNPEIAVLTNTVNALNNPARKSLGATKTAIYGTLEHAGIVAEFTDNGINLYENIDEAVK